ncbi:MAG: glutamate racemase, partial [FCB group bacterium]|nr:glutamate racemase [FCB group bacterium]
ALKVTLNHHIGVIGTIATISSGSYEKLLKKQNRSVKVISQPCPLFVPLVEEGWLEGDVTTAVVKKYLQPLNKAEVDTLILGCTHYPLLKPVLQKQVNPGTVLVDSAEAVAAKTARVLDKNELRTDGAGEGSLYCFVTDLPARFETVAGRFLGASLTGVKTVHLP